MTQADDGRPGGLSSLRDGASKLSPPKASIPDAGLSEIYIRFSDCGQHIRKWSSRPFDGATVYAQPVADEATNLMRFALEAIDSGRSEPLFAARDSIHNWLENDPAQAIAARSDETPAAAQPERQERDPQDAP